MYRACGDHRDGRSDGLSAEDERFWVIAEVRLVEQNYRASAALPDNRQVAFNSSQVEVLIERNDQKDDIHICR
jgi:hypothetical protein